MRDEELNYRKWMLSQGMNIENSQLSLDTYLDRLNSSERNALLTIASDFGISFRYKHFRNDIRYFSILGIGTTTYGDDYWEDLKKFFYENDSEKINYTNNKGEDIDLMLCPEHKNFKLINSHNSNSEKKDIKQKEDIFDQLVKYCANNNIKYTNPGFEDDNFGTHYFKVPEEIRSSKDNNYSDEKIVRIKGKDYGHYTMKVFLPNCRPIHIYVDDFMTTAQKIEYEKINNMPFTVIYRAGCIDKLEELVKYKNNTS